MQYWIDRYAADCDIRIEPIVMTTEQAEKYPKALDGSGAVELDAMEAIDPGRLERIVRRAISPFRDWELRSQVAEVAQEAQYVLDKEFEEAAEDELSELREIEAVAQAVYERYRETLSEVAGAMEEELEPLRERLEDVEASIQDNLSLFDPDLPGLPDPERAPEGADESWLFDARRDYLEQLLYFKRSQAS